MSNVLTKNKSKGVFVNLHLIVFFVFCSNYAKADMVDATLSNPTAETYTINGENSDAQVVIDLTNTPTVKSSAYSAPPDNSNPFASIVYTAEAKITYTYQFIITENDLSGNSKDVLTNIESYLYAFYQTGYDFSYSAEVHGSIYIDDLLLHELGNLVSVSSYDSKSSSSYENEEYYTDEMYISSGVVHTLTLCAYAKSQNGFAYAVADPYITIEDPGFTITFSPGINNNKPGIGDVTN